MAINTTNTTNTTITASKWRAEWSGVVHGGSIGLVVASLAKSLDVDGLQQVIGSIHMLPTTTTGIICNHSHSQATSSSSTASLFIQASLVSKALDRDSGGNGSPYSRAYPTRAQPQSQSIDVAATRCEESSPSTCGSHCNNNITGKSKKSNPKRNFARLLLLANNEITDIIA
ncbi:GL14386 [Drosophila persimilis]|uniref:GL14386 n=1 Tax=Drosophila persimilis TaxID=7234 RepID=B4GQE6_DROPE|nr:GL14386 [Drosophila persimilis]